MEEEIIQLDKQSKWIYGLYNFFVPYLLYVLIIGEFYDLENENTNIVNVIHAGYWSVVFLVISIALVILGLLNYRNFVKTDKNNIYICRKKHGQIQVLHLIPKNEILSVKNYADGSIYIRTSKQNNIKVFNAAASILLIILTAPIFCIPFALKSCYLTQRIIQKIKFAAGLITTETDLQNIRKQQKQMLFINIGSWCFLVIIIVIGLVGLYVGLLAGLIALESLIE